MRKLLVVLAVAGLAAPALAAESQPGAPQVRLKPAAEAAPNCQYQAEHAVATPGAKGRVMKPTEVPPARLERAVNRRINGCVAPYIVRYDVEKRDR